MPLTLNKNIKSPTREELLREKIEGIFKKMDEIKKELDEMKSII